MRSVVSTRSHHKPLFWELQKVVSIVQFCHRVIFALIVFVLCYSVVAYGTTQEWTQGPVIIAVLLAVFFWAIRLALVNGAEMVLSPLSLPMLFTGSYLIIRYALSDVEPVSRSSMLMPVTAVIFFFVVLNEIRHRWQVTTVVWLITGLGALLALYGLFQSTIGARWVLGKAQFAQYFGHASGTFFRPANLAMFLKIAFAIAAANFILSHRPKIEKIGFAFICLITGCGLFLTLSPEYWIGWIAMFCVLVFFAVRTRTWRFRWVIAGLSILAVVGSTIVMSKYKPSGDSNTEGTSLQAELDNLVLAQSPLAKNETPVLSPRSLREAALAVGHPNIWIGSGGGMFPWLFPLWRTNHGIVQGVVEHCPNQYLDVFASYGLMGVGLMLWIGIHLVLALVQIIRLRDTKYGTNRPSNRYALVAAGLAIMAAVIVDAWIDLRLHTGGLLFPLTAVSAIALTCGIHRRIDEERKHPRPGHHITLSLTGSSRIPIVVGLVGIMLLIGSRVVATYPSALFLRHGQQALERLDWSAAERAYQRAWRFNKRDYKVATAIGDLYAARSTWKLSQRDALSQSAFEWYNRSIKLNQYNTDIRIKIGRLYDTLNQREAAMAAYQVALDTDPRNASYHVALGQHYQRWGDAAEAEHQFRLARELGATEALPDTEITN